jgi:acetyltransferase-like isoleucine patch superfamily enzyme
MISYDHPDPADHEQGRRRLSSWRALADDGHAVLAARWYLRHADSVGAKARVFGRPIVRNRGTMIFGERVKLLSNVARLELVALEGGRLEVGERTLINHGGSFCAAERVRLGARCLIGPHVMVLDNDFHRIEPARRLEWPESRPIEIADNVWLGARVIVLGGVTIGEGSCVGAGSVVVDDVPPYTFAAGVPARVIRDLPVS